MFTECISVKDFSHVGRKELSNERTLNEKTPQTRSKIILLRIIESNLITPFDSICTLITIQPQCHTVSLVPSIAHIL